MAATEVSKGTGGVLLVVNRQGLGALRRTVTPLTASIRRSTQVELLDSLLSRKLLAWSAVAHSR
jgi:hypothetical protein